MIVGNNNEDNYEETKKSNKKDYLKFVFIGIGIGLIFIALLLIANNNEPKTDSGGKKVIKRVNVHEIKGLKALQSRLKIFKENELIIEKNDYVYQKTLTSLNDFNETSLESFKKKQKERYSTPEMFLDIINNNLLYAMYCTDSFKEQEICDGTMDMHVTGIDGEVKDVALSHNCVGGLYQLLVLTTSGDLYGASLSHYYNFVNNNRELNFKKLNITKAKAIKIDNLYDYDCGFKEFAVLFEDNRVQIVSINSSADDSSSDENRFISSKLKSDIINDDIARWNNISISNQEGFLKIKNNNTKTDINLLDEEGRKLDIYGIYYKNKSLYPELKYNFFVIDKGNNIYFYYDEELIDYDIDYNLMHVNNKKFSRLNKSKVSYISFNENANYDYYDEDSAMRINFEDNSELLIPFSGAYTLKNKSLK